MIIWMGVYVRIRLKNILGVVRRLLIQIRY